MITDRIDLPNLKSIKLGAFALYGKGKDLPCSLKMKGNNELYHNI